MPEYVRAAYRLVPDRRFLFAVREVSKLVSEKRDSTLVLGFKADRWTLNCAGAHVGTLPRHSSFGDGLELLTDWSRRIASQSPAATSPSAGPASDVARNLELFFAPYLLDALEEINRAWRTPSREPTLVAAAVRSIIFLRLQTFDRLEISDYLSGKALALLAIARASDAEALLREEVLLSALMGYDSHAASQAAQLPKDDPVRSFALRRDAELTLLAKARPADRLGNYLCLLRLSEGKDLAAWSAWVRDNILFYSNLTNPPVLSAALALDDFGTTPVLARAMRLSCLWSLLAETEKQGFSIKSSGFASAADITGEVAQFVEGLDRRLELTEEKLLERFEERLKAASKRQRGPVLDEETVRAHYAADFYSALYETGRFYLDRLSSHPRARELAESLGNPTSPVGGELKKWIEDRASVYESRADPSVLLADIENLDRIGARPLARMRRSADQYLSAQNSARRRMGRHFLQKLDLRPEHLAEAARIAYNELNDLRRRDEFLSSVAAEAPRELEELLSWFGSLSGESSVLKKMAEMADLQLETRSAALKTLLKADRGEEAYVESGFRELLPIDPKNLLVLDDYVEFQEKRGNPEEARRTLSAWLDANSGQRDLGWVHVATQLSKVLERQGKLDDAWKVIEPVVSSYKSEAMEQAALLLEKLGRHKEAREVAERHLERYPSSGDSSAVMAEVLWRQKGYAAAADVLRRYDKFLTRTDWYYPVAAAFSRTFANAPAGEVEKAFAELTRSRFEREKLSALTSALGTAGRHDLAATLPQRIGAPASENIYDWIKTYQELKKWKGGAAAADWLKVRMPPSAWDHASLAFYYSGEDDLLWAVPARPDETKNHMLHLFRAAALVRQRKLEDSRRQALADTLNSVRNPDRFVLYARYLLGLEEEAKILQSPKDMSERCDVAYFVGLKKVSEKKYSDAMDWFQSALETGQDQTPMYNATIAFLAAWARAEKSFQRIEAEGL